MTEDRWRSVSEVVAEFHLGSDVADCDFIVSELKSRRAELHPDKTGGTFSSEAESIKYHSLNDAITFIEQQRQVERNIVPMIQLREIVKTEIENALAPAKRVDSQAQQEQFLKDFRNQSSEHSTLPRLTSGILGVVFSGIIAFTEKLKDNVILSPVMRLKAFPYLMWGALFLSGIWFVRTWLRERDEKNYAEELTTDGWLLRNFGSFCEDLRRRRGPTSAHVWEFGKVEYAQSFQERRSTMKLYHLRQVLRIRTPTGDIERGHTISRLWHARQFAENVTDALKASRSLSAPLAERLAAIHISRLLGRRIIRTSRTVDLDDRYEIDADYLERIVQQADGMY